MLLSYLGRISFALLIVNLPLQATTTTDMHDESELKVEESTGILERQDVPQLDLVVLRLKNGMKVYLKKTFNEDDLVVRLTALGGYSSLPPFQWASGKYASETAIRSGIGEYYFDQLYALLYDHSIEFNSEIQPFSRHVEGTAYMGEVETLLSLIHQFFTDHRFTEHSFKKVMEKAKEKVKHRSKDSSREFEDAYIALNLQNLSVLQPLTAKDLANADYRTSKKIFENSFQDPSEFACVVVGPLDLEKMISLIDKHLSTIPQTRHRQTVCKLPEIDLTIEGVKTKVIHNSRYAQDSMTKITFPVSIGISQENYILVDNLAQLLNILLKKSLREKYGESQVVINVASEYPFYPCLCSPWMIIEYHTDPKFALERGKFIIEELKKIRGKLVASDDIVTMQRKYRKALNLKEKENSYWIMMLSNYALWGWNPKSLPVNLEPEGDPKVLSNSLWTFFSLDDYTMISAQP